MILFPFKILKVWRSIILYFFPLQSLFLLEKTEEIFNDKIVQDITHISNDGSTTSLKIYTPNSINHFRVESFSTKEPETLEWIDKYGEGKILYDIGANIGLFSLYFSKKYLRHSYAFEPSVFNLECLARNINLNNLQDFITIMPFALSEKTFESKFYCSSVEMGSAHSTFGKKIGHDGLILNSKFDYMSVGFALDFLANNLKMQPPGLIKIDVDGIEDLVLKGAQNILASPDLISILVEVNEDHTVLSHAVSTVLMHSGFVLKEKRQSEMFVNSTYSNSYNQIWTKNGI
jgi:FkbM family methyltransferase